MIHRHNFTKDFRKELIQFGRENEHLYISDFKSKWKEWKETNSSNVLKEKELLKKNGYSGNINDKMYHAVRYYFKKKSGKKNKPKERKEYSGMERKILNLIDRHIVNIEINTKPQTAYNNFKEIHYPNIKDNELTKKLKKTYKNRLYYYRNH